MRALAAFVGHIRVGVPREAMEVGRYVAPPQRRPGTARRLAVRRRGSRLAVTWRPGRGGARQQASVQLSDGRRLLFRLSRRARSLSVPGVGSRITGRVTVTALRADGYAGRTATARLRAARRGRPR